MGRLITGAGYTGSIGGTITVYGTPERQTITVADVAGTVSFDPSFNKGGDTIVLAKSASSYTIAQIGSTVVLSDGDSRIVIPVGTIANTIQFSDGDRTLIFSGGVKIASQAVTTTATTITATGTTKSALADDSATQAARLVLSEESASVGGNVLIYGSAGSEVVSLVGVQGKITLDASFNRGGDRIDLSGAPASYSAVRSGSTVVLSAGDRSYTVPIGTAGLDLNFDGEVRTLKYSDAKFLIGAEPISASPMALNPLLYQPLTLRLVSSIKLVNDPQTGGMNGEAFAQVDLNNDGKRELIFFPSMLRNVPGPGTYLESVIALNLSLDGKLSEVDLSKWTSTPIQSEWVQDAIVADFTGDKVPDLLIAGTGVEPPVVNDQRGEDIVLVSPGSVGISLTKISEIASESGFWHGISAGDFDKDGDLDVLAVNLNSNTAPKTLYLFQNDGKGHFSIATLPEKMANFGGSPGGVSIASFIDYNNDGWLDLFVGSQQDWSVSKNAPRENLIYVNRSGGFTGEYVTLPFTTLPSGVISANISTDKVKIFDYDRDGYDDMLIMYANYVEDAGRYLQLMKNNGDGSFTEVEFFKGMYFPRYSDGFEFFDFNGDGLFDVYQSIQIDEKNQDVIDVFDFIYINTGNGFSKLQDLAGVNFEGFNTDFYYGFLRFVKEDDRVFLVVTRSYDWKSASDNKTEVTSFLFSGGGDLAVSADTFYGSIMADNIRGSAAVEVIYAGLGHDTISGLGGDDTLHGGPGNDVLIGGEGSDNLYGGDGADRFVFDDPAFATDRIGDFEISNDLIVLQHSAFPGLDSSIMANQIYVAPGATVATTVNQRLIYDSQSGKLFFDQDGSATAFAPTLIATLMGAPSISTNSFMVG